MNNEIVINKDLKLLIEDAIYTNTQDEIYGEVVEKFVRQNYSQSRVEAIMNNYLDDMSNIKHYNEFKALQDYRKECKVYAKQLLGIE